MAEKEVLWKNYFSSGISWSQLDAYANGSLIYQKIEQYIREKQISSLSAIIAKGKKVTVYLSCDVSETEDGILTLNNINLIFSGSVNVQIQLYATDDSYHYTPFWGYSPISITEYYTDEISSIIWNNIYLKREEAQSISNFKINPYCNYIDLGNITSLDDIILPNLYSYTNNDKAKHFLLVAIDESVNFGSTRITQIVLDYSGIKSRYFDIRKTSQGMFKYNIQSWKTIGTNSDSTTSGSDDTTSGSDDTTITPPKDDDDDIGITPPPEDGDIGIIN